MDAQATFSHPEDVGRYHRGVQDVRSARKRARMMLLIGLGFTAVAIAIHQATQPDGFGPTALLAVSVIAPLMLCAHGLAIFSATWRAEEEIRQSIQERRQSRFTYERKGPGLWIITDRATGVRYLENSRGSMTPLLRSDGSPDRGT